MAGPALSDGDEVIIKERPLNAPASTERILGRNLYFFPDQNVWYSGGKDLIASLKSCSSLLPGHDLSNVKIRTIDINGNEITNEPVDLEKAAIASGRGGLSKRNQLLRYQQCRQNHRGSRRRGGENRTQ